MKRVAIGFCLFALIFCGILPADEEETPPVPGPEMQPLKSNEGIWDAVMEVWVDPGLPPQLGKGTENSKMECGGLWLVSDFQGQMLGRPYQGHGVYGYDQNAKHYTGIWVDSLQSYVASFQGSYDTKAKTLTMWTETANQNGAMVRWRGVTEWKDDNTRVWTAYTPGSDGKEFVSMRITYKRRSS